MMNFSAQEKNEGDRFMVYGAITFGVVGLILLSLGLVVPNGILCTVGVVFVIIGVGIRMSK